MSRILNPNGGINPAAVLQAEQQKIAQIGQLHQQAYCSIIGNALGGRLDADAEEVKRVHLAVQRMADEIVFINLNVRLKRDAEPEAGIA